MIEKKVFRVPIEYGEKFIRGTGLHLGPKAVILRQAPGGIIVRTRRPSISKKEKYQYEVLKYTEDGFALILAYQYGKMKFDHYSKKGIEVSDKDLIQKHKDKKNADYRITEVATGKIRNSNKSEEIDKFLWDVGLETDEKTYKNKIEKFKEKDLVD